MVAGAVLPSGSCPGSDRRSCSLLLLGGSSVPRRPRGREPAPGIGEAAERELRRRTLTNLYNARPAWLSHLHAALDSAVFAAYGWPESVSPSELGEEELLGRLLGLNLARAG